MSDLSQIVKAYDVRGVVPDQLDEAVAPRRSAPRSSRCCASRRRRRPRSSSPTTCASPSPGWRAAFADGATRPGADVVDIGLGSTDLLYFASGSLDLPGAMFTASHNPAQYNGIKLCRAGRRAGRPGHRAGRDPRRWPSSCSTACDAGGRRPARIEQRDLLADYAALPARAGRPVRHPAAEGRRRRRQRHGRPHRAGRARRPVLPALPLEIVPLYFELDGTFPNHEANPLDPANLVDLQAAVREHGADIGLAFDGDADRCFVDRRARRAGLAVARSPRWSRSRELAKRPGSDGHPQPDHLARGAGDRPRARRRRRCAPGSGTRSSRPRWPGPTRSSAASTRRTTTSATSGSPTPACWPRCTCWPRSASRTGRCRELAADVRALRRLRRDQLHGRRRRPAQDRRGAGRVRRTAATVDELDGLTVDAARRLRGSTCAPSNTEPLLRLNVEAPDAGPDGRAARRGARHRPRLGSRSTAPTHAKEPLGGPRPAAAGDPGLPGHAPRAARRTTRDGAELTCTACGRVFPVRDGIPVLLLDEARPARRRPAGWRARWTASTGVSGRRVADESLLDDAAGDARRRPGRHAAAPPRRPAPRSGVGARWPPRPT